MPDRTHASSGLRGVGRLSVDAINAIVDLVEAMHQTIASAGGLLGESGQQRTGAVAGMVYQSIRTITGWVGSGLEVLLEQLSGSLSEGGASPKRQAVLAALNGVLGDHLVATANPLAIAMQFRRAGRPLGPRQVFEIVQQAHGRVAVLVHGSCLNDLQWTRRGHDHGAALARDLGLAPLYLHYNTGLHISENGRAFADLLEACIGRTPLPPELFMVAHSMGGLVARSACYYAKRVDHTWLRRLQKLIFLGTPHHGALLEKGGSVLETLLQISPYSAPFARLGRVRSAGVTDMRHGSIVDEDWRGRDRFEISSGHRTPVPLPDAVPCYAMAATTGESSGKLVDGLIGDGLVTLDGALGRHKDPVFDLGIPQTHQWVGRNMNHLDLLSHADVYATMRRWLSDPDGIR